MPHLGLTLAPASAVDGAGGKGVVVTGIDPDGTAAEHGLQTGDVILDVGGQVGRQRRARCARCWPTPQSHGRANVLMRVKSGDATRFVALPLGNA